jgi:hypothetical protein
MVLSGESAQPSKTLRILTLARGLQSCPALLLQFPPYNYDFLSESESKTIRTCLAKHRAIISEAYLLPTPYV